MPTNDKLKKLSAAMKSATAQMEAELKNQYPVKSLVLVKLSVNQNTPTTGTVIGHRKDYLRVRLATTAQAVRDIHFEQVVSGVEVSKSI